MRQWNRRQVLAGLGFAGAHLVAQKSSLMTPDYIDAHVHVWKPADAAFPYDPKYHGPKELPLTFTPEQLLSIARPAGVKQIVLVQMSFYGTDNSYMLDAMRRHPSVFSGVAVVDYDSPSVAREIDRLHASGVRGFRVSQGDRQAGWLEAANMRRFWRIAAEKQMAICPLVDPEALPSLDLMCTEFPDTTVVIDHMARIGMAGPVRDGDVSSLCKLSRHPRVRVKVSAFYALGSKQAPYTDLTPLIHALHDAFGPKRLMWGSDSPYQVQPPHTYTDSLDLVRNRLPFLRPEDKDWLLRKTAQSIFF